MLPVDARVLLAGDHTVWNPGGGEAGAELWTHLRLLFCRAVWHQRCCWAAAGQVYTAATVVALSDVTSATSWVQRAIRLDWLRVTSDLAGASASLPTWCSIHTRFDLSQADLEERCCLGSVLAHVSSGCSWVGCPVCSCATSAWHLDLCCFQR